MMNNSYNPGKPDPMMTNYGGGFGQPMQPQVMPQNTGIVPPQMQGMGGFGQQFGQRPGGFMQGFGERFGQRPGGFGGFGGQQFGQHFGGMGGGFQPGQGFGGGGSVGQNMGMNGAPDFPPQFGVR